MSGLKKLVADELSAPVDPRVEAIAAAIAAKHGASSRAILFYGSCLRRRELEEGVLDFYLIVSNYREAYEESWLAAANRLIPPNVFYFEHEGLASKYAVLSEEDFAHECSPNAWTVSTAARFAQPSRLVWSFDEASRERTIKTVSEAAPTLLSWAYLVVPKDAPVLDTWKRAFELTFGAELRAERSEHPAAIVDADPRRYELFSGLMGPVPCDPGRNGARWWSRKQRHGKLYSLARLTKASLTFSNGADYIAWKINRHAGTDIRLSPWQQRHPLLAAITLLPRLLRSGAVR
jgi:hypothetical protein